MRINNKYKIGEIVFYMKENRIQTGRIAYIRIWISNSGVTIQYQLASYGCASGSVDYYEGQLYKTKDELVDKL